MMGRPMQVSSVIFQDWLTMKNSRKAKRPVYHIRRLRSSLRASLMSLVSVVMRDTRTPETEMTFRSFRVYCHKKMSPLC